MGIVHDILGEKGRQATLMLDFDREVVEAASAYMSDEDAGVGFLYSGWCQAALPHKKLPDSKGWQVDGNRFCLIVEPGMRRGPTGEPVHIGVPFGSRARLILIYLQSEALRTSSREVLLGKSLRDWMERMGIPVGGKNLLAVREQTERISRCRLTFEIRQGSRVGFTNQSIMDAAIFLEPAEDDAQRGLFAQTARLSEAFFDGLRRHPVPIEEAAIGAISNNSMAIDIYVWLAYRLHSLNKPSVLSWHAVKTQFGAGFAAMNNFKIRFLPNLRLAMAVYPDARVTVDDDGLGLILYPSKPPVTPKQGLAVRAG
ncbi:MAG: replication protein RepA [Candidatus Eremiobacteraeota bacterium]|jgi:replication initiator protein|nr:replication protein RepA [Candidatus Eremiobacteraeota bacterium]